MRNQVGAHVISSRRTSVTGNAHISSGQAQTGDFVGKMMNLSYRAFSTICHDRLKLANELFSIRRLAVNASLSHELEALPDIF